MAVIAAGMRGFATAEWPTLGLVGFCYGGWIAVLWSLGAQAPVVAALLLVPLIVLHASLTHEVLHGHPFASRRLNAMLVALPLNPAVPYARFRDLHLAHHLDCRLTDPYDDPESNFLDPARWARMPATLRALYLFNNTLAGRMLIGPAMSQIGFMRSEARLALSGDRAVICAWASHGVGVALAVWIACAWAGLPVLAYLGAVYGGLAVLRIRTFLEHRAHVRARARTVIIEDRGPLALLFLNNNLHVVHHIHPGVPWYRLPAVYAKSRGRYLAQNDAYVYRSYGEVFARYFLRCKDPVAHPLWPGD